jgi:uncharacterized DUF497 family protein
MMDIGNHFEFDEAKSRTNKDKHGIDFEQARWIFQDGRLVVLDAQFVTEPRSIAIGEWAGKMWTVVFTVRRGVTRIISVRRARTQEIRCYESQSADRND